METLKNWFTVCKSELNSDLSFWMPYEEILKLKMNRYKVDPIFIGDINKRRVILTLDNYLEKNHVLSNGEEIELGNINEDFEKIVINRVPKLYNWKIDENLILSGYLYNNDELIQFEDEIVRQNDNILTLKSNKVVFVVWNSMSQAQQQFLTSLNDEERVKLCPSDFGGIKNCKMDLTTLIRSKEEREKRRKAFEEIDVPRFSKKYY